MNEKSLVGQRRAGAPHIKVTKGGNRVTRGSKRAEIQMGQRTKGQGEDPADVCAVEALTAKETTPEEPY